MERPRLRPDLELLRDRPEDPAVLVYDPARRVIFELAAEDRAVLDLLDGSRSPQDIARQAGRALDDLLDLLDDLADMLLLEDSEQAGFLEEWRRRHKREDLLLQPILDTRPVTDVVRVGSQTRDAQPIHVVDDARHTCVCCGDCCHYAVPISSEERRRLAEVVWPEEVVPEEAGRLFLLRPRAQWGQLEGVIATHSNPTRCAFLDEDNLCRVHRRLGAPAKPFACRLFPLAYPVATPERLLFSLTFECPWIFKSYDTGERLAGRPEELRALATEMEEIYTLPTSIPLDGERELAVEEYLSWERALLETAGAPAREPRAFLERLRRQWAQISPLEPGPVPSETELGSLAGVLRDCLQENRATLAESPEREAGVAWAGRVLESLAGQPEAAWAPLHWADGPAADGFLERFRRHFIEGKQHLLYQPLWVGLRVLSVLLLLARQDAAMMAQQAGGEAISLAALNRALSRWCCLCDIHPLRLALISSRGFVRKERGSHRIDDPAEASL